MTHIIRTAGSNAKMFAKFSSSAIYFNFINSIPKRVEQIDLKFHTNVSLISSIRRKQLF